MISCAILGTGKIGIDLYVKIKKSNFVKNVEIYNLNKKSIGHIFCKKNKFNVFDTGIDGILNKINEFDVIIDATSSYSNKLNYNKLKNYLFKNKFFLNMTPSGIGKQYIPFFFDNGSIPNKMNLISCGGQSTIPIINSIKNYLKNKLKYVEVVSSISSISAGPATRANVNDYIMSTNNAIQFFSKIKKSKVILNLNPTDPPVNMMNTIFFECRKKIEDAEIKEIKKIIIKINKRIKSYIPGYNATYFKDLIDDKIFRVTIRVVGAGDYLPSYAGNLDIINSSALEIIRLINEKKNSYN